jgi:hypothetical protein
MPQLENSMKIEIIFRLGFEVVEQRLPHHFSASIDRISGVAAD